MAAITKSASRVLSVLERAKLVCWFEETNSLVKTGRRYQAEFGMDPPPLAQVKKLHRAFLATGSVMPPNWDAEEMMAAEPPLADNERINGHTLSA